LHLNTEILIKIEDKAIDLGWYDKYPKKSFCQEVARRCGESGNENPSNKAIKIALNMLYKLVKRNRFNPSKRNSKIKEIKRIKYVCPHCKNLIAELVFPKTFNSTLIYCPFCEAHRIRRMR